MCRVIGRQKSGAGLVRRTVLIIVRYNGLTVSKWWLLRYAVGAAASDIVCQFWRDEIFTVVDLKASLAGER